jgi:glycosyltransferase involved in cell wall biosynthesis
LKIAVNTRLLLKGKLEGIGWFTYETLKRITRLHPEHHFFFLFDRPFDEEFIFSDNITPIIISPQARHPFLYYLWFQYSVPGILNKLKPDLFLSPDGYITLKSRVKTLTVFHDLNFEHYPQDVPFSERWYYRKFFPKFAAKADRIATVSEFSKNDIIKLYNVSPEKIDVVYNGANEIYSPVSQEKQDYVKSSLTSGMPYFYFIGSLHPRKNLINLFKAYDLFRAKSDLNVKLVVTGAKKWWVKEIDQAYNSLKFRQDIIFTGRLPVEKIKDLMGSALALTYVSYFEGFGIPIVEAFRCGTPVITSNVTSMPEVAGNAAITVDPFKPDDIADAMLKLSQDNQLREDLKQKGFERAEMFTWDKSAERLWNSIEKVLQSN